MKYTTKTRWDLTINDPTEVQAEIEYQLYDPPDSGSDEGEYVASVGINVTLKGVSHLNVSELQALARERANGVLSLVASLVASNEI